GQGAIDLHSGRSQVDFDRLAARASGLGAAPSAIASANTVLEVLSLTGPGLADRVAEDAEDAVLGILRGAPVSVETVIVDRAGDVLARRHFT
ncbi:MAG: cobalt-precorrin-5B (C(1))-methyltransferase, partial [Pseudomonadota bacterium]